MGRAACRMLPMPEHYIRTASPARVSPEALGGILLICAAMLALVWANGPLSKTYESLWLARPHWHGYASHHSLRFWINDALMGLFFLTVGQELRWELKFGALASRAVALLPLLAAAGGALLPATIYLALAPQIRAGWGIPVATDIAFAVGVMALLGNRVSPQTRVLLLGIAIADDFIAILVIALFYSGGLAAHPSVVGAVIGLLWPPSARSAASDHFDSPLTGWVNCGVLPLFAIANAGVPLDALRGHDASALTVTAAVTISLAFGKPIGIALATRVATSVGMARLPAGLIMGDVILIGLTGGIGFTMAMFIATLAFDDQRLLAAAKLGVLLASTLAAAATLIYGRFSATRK